MIPGSKGEFESGFSNDGQTREHAILAKSFGVDQIVVAVNKLDAVEWSQERYESIAKNVVPFLTSVGYKKENIATVPVR